MGDLLKLFGRDGGYPLLRRLVRPSCFHEGILGHFQRFFDHGEVSDGRSYGFRDVGCRSHALRFHDFGQSPQAGLPRKEIGRSYEGVDGFARSANAVRESFRAHFPYEISRLVEDSLGLGYETAVFEKFRSLFPDSSGLGKFRYRNGAVSDVANHEFQFLAVQFRYASDAPDVGHVFFELVPIADLSQFHRLIDDVGAFDVTGTQGRAVLHGSRRASEEQRTHDVPGNLPDEVGLFFRRISLDFLHFGRESLGHVLPYGFRIVAIGLHVLPEFFNRFPHRFADLFVGGELENDLENPDGRVVYALSFPLYRRENLIPDGSVFEIFPEELPEFCDVGVREGVADSDFVERLLRKGNHEFSDLLQFLHLFRIVFSRMDFFEKLEMRIFRGIRDG